MKKTRRTADEGFPMISRYLSSGVSVEQFCKKENISPAGFYLWKKRYTVSTEATDRKKQFYPVSIADSVGDLIGGLSVTYPNGVELRLDSGVSIAELRQLIRLFR
jgi:transposase-like protein